MFAIARQQQILAYLGFYDGEIDGIWGEESQKAMRLFESTYEFKPGDSTYGQPLCVFSNLPNIVYFNDLSATFHVRGVSDEELPPYSDKLFDRLLGRDFKNNDV